MPDYGITDKGFVLKRLDTILEEIHTDLTDGWKVDTRLAGTSFLNTLITTFGNQIANLWETAQDSYYAKYPATATELNLDHAVQYGGIKRAGDKRTSYILHCTGDDGTYVRENAVVATNTTPEIRLFQRRNFRLPGSGSIRFLSLWHPKIPECIPFPSTAISTAIPIRKAENLQQSWPDLQPP